MQRRLGHPVAEEQSNLHWPAQIIAALLLYY